MSALKMFIGKHAPTHHAEKYWPTHDGSLNIAEARRGRGKSAGAVKIAAEWLKERWDDIVSGKARFAKVLSNIKLKIRRLALLLCRMQVAASLQQALDTLERVIVYVTHWDQLLTAFDSLVLLDEANRNLNIYDNAKNIQNLMLCLHDWLQQTRKHILTLWFFVQDVSWIKGQVLSLADKLWRVKRVRIKGTPKIKYFPWYGGDPFSKGKDGPLNRSADFKMRFDFDLWVAMCYDTLQAVETLDPVTQFKSFGEISDYMYAHGMKPEPVQHKADYLTWAQEQEWFEKAKKVELDALELPILGWTAAGGARVSPPPLPPEARRGGGGGSHVLPPVLDLSHLPTSYPKELL